MGGFVKGSVVVVPFPFSDLSGSKRRPALVVAELEGEDIILCQITSKARTDKYALPLEAADFATGSLPQPSVIRTNKLFTAESGMVLYQAGVLSESKMQEVTDAIIGILNT
jgi:mRNA interferase MazF